ncbi:MAG: YceI family protein [Flavobacteriales bacterium]|nr:YceI family protein [Flavobacteriales bacterium]
MKKVISLFGAASIALFFASCGTEPSTEEVTKTDEAVSEDASQEGGPSGSFTLSSDESMLGWEGSMVKIGGISLYGHNGTINFEKGMMTMKNGKITDGTFVVDMTTITPTDDAYDEENTSENLVGHLSSPDFFAVDSFPTATFVVTGMEGDKIMGDMTIRGVTNPETIEGVSLDVMDGKVKAKGSMTIDRQKYNVAFSMGPGEKILSDDLGLEFTIIASADEAAM